METLGWGGVGWGGVGCVGVGWGGVKIMISNDKLSHAHFHPPSHNIRKVLDEESLATSKENKYIITEDYIEWRALCYDDRRVCLRCENNFCYDCFMKMYASKNSREYDNIEATNKNYFRPICRNPICGRLNIKGRLKICYCDEEDTLFLPENLFYDNITKYTKYKNV
jgi:hypothetical protein